MQKRQLWEYTHIKHQIDRREREEPFSISDHILGMVYSLLSSGIAWKRAEKIIDLETGRLLPIDTLFHQYDPEQLLQCSPEQLKDGIQGSPLCQSIYPETDGRADTYKHPEAAAVGKTTR